MKLLPGNLSQLGPMVSVPGYDRSELKPGILHIGVGNFHRAHQAVYAHDLLAQGGDPAWGICGAGVRPEDRAMRDKLKAQGWLSTVVETDGETLTAQITGAMMNFLPVEAGHGPLIAAIAAPETRIVSLTITEGGYFIDSGGAFDADHPDIRFDVENPDHPVTVFGALLAGLEQRKAQSAPITVMSCDNLPGNGDLTRRIVLGCATIMRPGLRSWIEDNVSFPNSMVDRITPATSPREIETMRDTFGLDDAAPVFCEPFRQWVVEDDFRAGRPAWEQVGVTMTDQVHAYEAMKIRVLNGGHAVIAYAAGLLGIEFAHEAMRDTGVAGFLRRTEMSEILPHVDPVGPLTPQQYLDQTIHRFENPGVCDTVRRLCFDGSNRQPKFIVPSIADCLAAGQNPAGLAMVSAMWARYCLGKTDDGAVIADNDPAWALRNQAALMAQTDPGTWLDQRDVYGDLGQDPGLRAAFVAAYEQLRRNGTRAVLG